MSRWSRVFIALPKPFWRKHRQLAAATLLLACTSGTAPKSPQRSQIAKESDLTGEERFRAQTTACRRDDVAACFSLADQLMRREPAGSHAALRTEMAIRGCELGHLVACEIAGGGYYLGSAGPVDREVAAIYFERACAGTRRWTACAMWSHSILAGRGRAIGSAHSLPALDALCHSTPSPLWCSAAVVLRLLDGPDLGSDAEGADRLGDYCDDGYAQACVYLAWVSGSRKWANFARPLALVHQSGTFPV
jgi:hypothetical protein